METNEMTIPLEGGVWKWSIEGFFFKESPMKSDR